MLPCGGAWQAWSGMDELHMGPQIKAYPGSVALITVWRGVPG